MSETGKDRFGGETKTGIAVEVEVEGVEVKLPSQWASLDVASAAKETKKKLAEKTKKKVDVNQSDPLAKRQSIEATLDKIYSFLKPSREDLAFEILEILLATASIAAAAAIQCNVLMNQPKHIQTIEATITSVEALKNENEPLKAKVSKLKGHVTTVVTSTEVLNEKLCGKENEFGGK
ncbi:hypothetical protein Fot_35348 [Forsythia ovata]|uniref:Uncharacterized protein n=1 Tax=Forsythia ovata TaxID=205694 RepID=A0ABD1SL91_9LAMI